jgi:DNA-binding transcriptional LysR family regulator
VAQALVVADCLSFRGAAKVLGIGQSAVSRSVRTLEDRLGVSLFERHPGGVRITNAGASFFQQARDGLRLFESAIKAAGAAGRGGVGRLNIGILSSMASGFLRELIEAYSTRHPDVVIQVHEGASAEQIGLVRKRQLDVGFVVDATGATDCDMAPLWKERLFVVLPRGHALCDQKEVQWADLRQEHFVTRQSEHNPPVCERLTKRLSDHTHKPRVQKLDVGRETLMHLVALGLGVSLTSEATVASSFPDVSFRPIVGDDELVQFSAVWLSSNDNPALRRFLSLARAQAKQKKRNFRVASAGAARSPIAFGGISLSFGFLVAFARRLGLST